MPRTCPSTRARRLSRASRCCNCSVSIISIIYSTPQCEGTAQLAQGKAASLVLRVAYINHCGERRLYVLAVTGQARLASGNGLHHAELTLDHLRVQHIGKRLTRLGALGELLQYPFFPGI